LASAPVRGTCQGSGPYVPHHSARKEAFELLSNPIRFFHFAYLASYLED
jgi:hypothetical protein